MFHRCATSAGTPPSRSVHARATHNGLDNIYSLTEPHPAACTVIPLRPSAMPRPKQEECQKPAARAACRSRVTVILFDAQRAALDAKLARAQDNGHRLARSQVMRALVDALIGSGIDLSRVRDEATLRSLLAEQFAASRRSPEEALRS